MASTSPSPSKRPSLTPRTSSTHSLSSSGKQTGHKTTRPHVVSRHSRNVSLGKGLSKLSKVNSTANVAGEVRGHQRKKSGSDAPSQSPKTPAAPQIKRNSSHVVLPKNTSHGNLRKNHSANALALNRNLSNPALKKIGLAPAPPVKDNGQKHGFFELGDQSSGGEEEAEWEDSATQSPDLTRNNTRDNSKTSTPARRITGNGEPDVLQASGLHTVLAERTSSPPHASLQTTNRSAPDLLKDPGLAAAHNVSNPALLQHNPRSSRAPPAMSTISAHAGPSQLPRNDSSRSFTHISHDEAVSPTSDLNTAGMGVSSSGSAAVSHFLPTGTPARSRSDFDDTSDYGSPSGFLSNYKPQLSDSPEKAKPSNKARLPHVPSRTQQRLELQRRETMRAGGNPPTTPPGPGMGFSLGSSSSLYSRSGSRGRNRSLGGELKALKQDYEGAIKQLTVVRRFRNPILESLQRLKHTSIVPPDVGTTSSVGAAAKSRPQSRRGPNASSSGHGSVKAGVSRSFEEDRPSPLHSRSASRGRGGRVSFQLARQGSHDEIGLTTSRGSPDGADEEQEGVSAEEALVRRLWQSREVYESGAGGLSR